MVSYKVIAYPNVGYTQLQNSNPDTQVQIDNREIRIMHPETPDQNLKEIRANANEIELTFYNGFQKVFLRKDAPINSGLTGIAILSAVTCGMFLIPAAAGGYVYFNNDEIHKIKDNQKFDSQKMKTLKTVINDLDAIINTTSSGNNNNFSVTTKLFFRYVRQKILRNPSLII